jgi:hypothetical protein
LPGDSEEPIVFTGTRSLGCQTVDPRNLEELYAMGVIRYSSTTKLSLSTIRRSEKRILTGGVEKKVPGISDDPDTQKLPRGATSRMYISINV